jgi:hypothetical protein
MKENNMTKTIAISAIVALLVSVVVFSIGSSITGQSIGVAKGIIKRDNQNWVGWSQGQKIEGTKEGFSFISTKATGNEKIATLDNEGNLIIKGDIISITTNTSLENLNQTIGNLTAQLNLTIGWTQNITNCTYPVGNWSNYTCY